MITLSKDSFWVRLAYTTREEWNIPTHTNVCALFWRGITTLFFEVMTAAALGYGLAWLGVLAYMYWTLLALMVVIGGAAIIMGLIAALARLIAEGAPSAAEYVKESVPGQAFIGWKEKHCRLVKIEHYD